MSEQLAFFEFPGPEPFWQPLSDENAAWIKWLYGHERRSQQDIAAITGVHPGTVCHVVHGRRKGHVLPRPMPGFRR